MFRSQLIQHTLEWVWGVCILWNQHYKQFNTPDEMQGFVHRTHDVVWKHLAQNKVLDGTCSDLECTTALTAERLFGEMVRNAQ